MDLKQRIMEICSLPDGVDMVGVAPVERFAVLPESERPSAFLVDARSVVVLGSQLFQVLTRQLTAHRKIGDVSYRDFYNAHNETVDTDLRQTGYRIARFLTNQGYPSINVGHDLTDYRTIRGAFSFKFAAACAGLGQMGKNGLLITPSHGPRVKLSAVLTSAPLEGEQVCRVEVCGDCDICLKACPSGALHRQGDGNRFGYDRFVCSSFLTANQGCGLCMARCPR